MDKRIKAKWVKALKSGKYKQGTTSMKRGDLFCGLGVLCDVYSKETGTPWKSQGASTYQIERFSMCSETAGLPVEVQQWAGLTGPHKHNPHVGGGRSLITLNDREGATFSQIAGEIELYL